MADNSPYGPYRGHQPRQRKKLSPGIIVLIVLGSLLLLGLILLAVFLIAMVLLAMSASVLM